MAVLFLDQWFSSGLAGDGLSPEDIWQCQETLVVCFSWGDATDI